MCPEKTFTPDRLRLLVDTLQKSPPAFGDVPRKNIQVRLPPVLGQSPTKSLASLRRCTSKKCLRPSASGCLFPPTTRPLQRPAAIPRKSTAPDCLRLLVDPLQKASPAFGDIPRKNVHARPPSAFGQSSTKSPASLRRYTPEKCLRPSASSCLFPPTARPLKRPAAMARKSVAPDSFRLLVNPFRKISPAGRCDDPKKCSSRQLPAFSQSFSKNLSRDPLR